MLDGTLRVVLATMKALARQAEQEGRHERAAGYRESARLLEQAWEIDLQAEAAYHQAVQEARDSN